MHTPPLSCRVALVTGAGSGIGQATAVALAREGADIVVNYRGNRDGAAATADAVAATGRQALTVQADHGEEDEVRRLFAVAVEAFGRVDLLVNNAADDSQDRPVAELDLARIERSLRSNLIGPFLCCAEFMRHRIEAGGGGRIINVTSIHEEVPMEGAALYCAAKGGVRNLTRVLALEGAVHGITVNNLAPGMVLTGMNRAAIDDPEAHDRQVANIPLRRAATAEEVARAAVFLASGDADYLTGSSLVIDGGLMQHLGRGA